MSEVFALSLLGGSLYGYYRLTVFELRRGALRLLGRKKNRNWVQTPNGGLIPMSLPKEPQKPKTTLLGIPVKVE